MFIFALLLMLLQVDLDSGEKYIQNFLNNTIHQEVTSESVWATGNLYYSANEAHQSFVERNIQNEQVWKALKNNSDFTGYLNELSFELKSKELFLAYLLLEDKPERRIQKHLQALEAGFINRIDSIIQKAVDGQSLISDNIDDHDLDFEHFLVSFHVRNNNISSTEFFQEISELELEKLSLSSLDNSADSYRLATLIKAYYETDQYRKIDKLYNSLELLDKLPYSRLKLNLLWGVDFALYRIGQFDRALHVQRTYTLPISNYLELESFQNSILASHGGYLYHIGKYHEAKNVFLSLLENAEELPKSFQASLYNNLSLVYYKTGESSNYVETQLKALDTAKELSNYSYQSRIYRNLHVFYRNNKNWNLASDYINQALTLAKQFSNLEDIIAINISRAIFEDQYLNNREKAFNYLEESISLIDSTTDSRIINRVNFELADLNFRDLNYSTSKSIFERIKSKSAAESDLLTFLEVLIKITQLETATNNYSEARELIKEVRAHDMSDLDFSILILAQSVQADIEAYFGNTQVAEELFSEAAQLVFERSRNTSETESGYWTVEKEYLYLFEKYADFLMDQNRNGDALALFDQIKTINDASLTDNPLIRSSQLSEEALTRIRNLTQEMDGVRRQILTAADSERLSLQNRLERLSAERRSLTNKTRQSNSDQIANFRSVQRQLRPSETLLHLTEIGQSLYYAVVQRNNIAIKKIELRDENLALFEDTLDSILKGSTDLQKLYEIGRILEIDQIAAHSRSIIVMPDSYFHQLPVGIFPIHEPTSSFSYGSAEYVIESTEVRTLNNLQDLATRNRSNNHTIGFSGFGVEDFNNESTSRSLVSLPKAPQEIISIKEQLSRLSNNRSFVNSTATAEQFQQNAGKSKILHMATHSEVSESDPLFSTLHFYSDGSEDQDQLLSGRLFAYELFDLNLQNDLIMLNSCESGGDRFLQGSGVMGISRALRYAGAKSLVLNAWSVNDHYAAEFAEEFYKHINNGESKSKALQLTKIHFIKNKNANPHYWGSYILNGDHKPLVTESNWFAGSLLLAVIFLSGLVLTGRKKQYEAAA